MNFGIINSITELHLVGISTEQFTMHGSMNIKQGVLLNQCAIVTIFYGNPFAYR